ncbi:hypothetical protein K505DRAFT_59600 [Melanomma pulvis-pyrius CBS 109.77]|uniref:Uncharacterized protein n=1 Tax=Melanomma pulvis-pyrius CBS 109.77 TaxID=1314802 RepID=A0A6A6X766_9PLEO|nr:hypothetical protein K505DRAFT_59600 [Melanomma pulvis-pyrius CBS 109.77]
MLEADAADAHCKNARCQMPAARRMGGQVREGAGGLLCLEGGRWRSLGTLAKARPRRRPEEHNLNSLRAWRRRAREDWGLGLGWGCGRAGLSAESREGRGGFALAGTDGRRGQLLTGLIRDANAADSQARARPAWSREQQQEQGAGRGGSGQGGPGALPIQNASYVPRKRADCPRLPPPDKQLTAAAVPYSAGRQHGAVQYSTVQYRTVPSM